MARKRITLEVDTIALFDSLAAIKGDAAGLGCQLAGVLMTGHAGLGDRIGLRIYGIEIASIEKVYTPAEEATNTERREA